MNRTYILTLSALNLLLATFIITTFDQNVSLVNGQQLDTNATETAATKANATETAATKANATETAATKD